MQKYVDKAWLLCSFHLAKCMRNRQVLNITDTINGTEVQNKTLEYKYLPVLLDKSIYGIYVMLVDRYVPDCHQRYLGHNVKLNADGIDTS